MSDLTITPFPQKSVDDMTIDELKAENHRLRLMIAFVQGGAIGLMEEYPDDPTAQELVRIAYHT